MSPGYLDDDEPTRPVRYLDEDEPPQPDYLDENEPTRPGFSWPDEARSNVIPIRPIELPATLPPFKSTEAEAEWAYYIEQAALALDAGETESAREWIRCAELIEPRGSSLAISIAKASGIR